MDWFHCNSCFVRRGKDFSVSNCGHIFCEDCISSGQCRVCQDRCSYLLISDQMKPQEKMFFTDPVKLLLTRLEHLAQISLFQQKQKERVIKFFRDRTIELERKLKEVREEYNRQLSELREEIEELKKPLSQRRTSPGCQSINGRTPRMILPVAITPPVTRQSRAFGSGDTLERYRQSRLARTTPPGSSISPLSLRSAHERSFRTSSSTNTPIRYHQTTPSNFQFQAQRRSALQSPMP